MKFTQVQIYEILEKYISEEGSIEGIFKMSLEILMRAEHNLTNSDSSNGYRFRKTYGRGKW